MLNALKPLEGASVCMHHAYEVRCFVYSINMLYTRVWCVQLECVVCALDVCVCAGSIRGVLLVRACTVFVCLVCVCLVCVCA